MSSFTKPLTTTYIGRGSWLVNESFSYHVGSEEGKEIIVVPKGFQTDFASVPWPASMLIPKNGDYNQAAVLHDYLYSLLGEYPIPNSNVIRVYTRKECDKIFLEAMGVLNSMDNLKIPYPKRRIMYRAVRMFGGFGWIYHGRRAKKLKLKNEKKEK